MSGIHPKWEPFRDNMEELFPYKVVIHGFSHKEKLWRGQQGYLWCEQRGLVRFDIYTHTDGSKHYNRDAQYWQMGFLNLFRDRDTAILFKLSLPA